MENKYYNAKQMKRDAPEEAIEGFSVCQHWSKRRATGVSKVGAGDQVGVQDGAVRERDSCNSHTYRREDLLTATCAPQVVCEVRMQHAHPITRLLVQFLEETCIFYERRPRGRSECLYQQCGLCDAEENVARDKHTCESSDIVT